MAAAYRPVSNRKRSGLPRCIAKSSMLKKFSKGTVRKTRMSELALLTSWVLSEGLADSRDVNTVNALLALRRLPNKRYGKTARDA